MKVVNQVQQTTDYSLFKILKGNRTPNDLHIERLKKSFKENYLLSPILVNQRYEIIDGQHRFVAAKALNLPLNFIMVNDYGLKEVQLLNTNMSNWKKVDYLKAFCDLGYTEYKKMKKFMLEFPEFGIDSAEQLVTNTVKGANNGGRAAVINGKSVGRVKKFQEGNLLIPSISTAYENAAKIMQIKPYYNGFNRSVFVAAMISMFKHPNYNHEQFISKLDTYPNSLKHRQNIKDYKIMIEEIFNYRSKNKVSLQY